MKNCLIMGSGRSGTSMLSGILHDAGYYMGEELYPPNISNPKGFFENSEINGINEKILSYYQSDERFNPNRFQRWLISINTDINITCDDEDALNRIQKATHKPLAFCYKDPRFSYTLPVWEPYLPEGTKFLCIFRTPQDTMQSILKECATADYLDDFYVNEEYAYSVWESIYQRILNFDHEIQKNVAYFHYDQIVTGESINTLSNFLEVDLDNSFSDTTLNRTDVNLEYIPKTCIDIYNKLCKKANFEDRIIFKSLTSDDEIEILKNRLQNKEMLLQKKSSSLRCKDNKLQASEQEKRDLEINKQRLVDEKQRLVDEKQRLVDEKKALENSFKKIYFSLSWKIGRTITKSIGIFLDLCLIKKLNKSKSFIYIRGLRFFKNRFIKSKPAIKGAEVFNKPILKIKVFFGLYPIYKLSKKKFEIVIARYNEDISWSEVLKNNRTIYNKGGKLEGINCVQLSNVGRESHTYLWHIVNNYEILADITLFSQGSINENAFTLKWLKKEPDWKRTLIMDTILSCRLLRKKILIAMPFVVHGVNGLDKDNRIKFWGKWLDELKTEKMRNAKHDLKTWMDQFVFSTHKFNIRDIIWSPHALIYVHKDLIHSNPKEYYEKLLSFVDDHINPMEGHYFERSWFHIFTRNYHRKISICTSCMNRFEHLKKTYLHNIEEGLKYPNIEFVLLNYNSQDGMDEWVKENLQDYIDRGIIKYIYSNESEYFKMSRTKNITGRAATGEIITWVDADNYLNSDILFDVNNEFILNEKIVMKPDTGKDGNWDSGCQIYVKKEHFEKVNGYDESFIGWGYDDLDFSERVRLYNHLELKYLENRKLMHKKAIAHEEQERLVKYNVYARENISKYIREQNINIEKIKHKWWFKDISRHTTNELNRIVSQKNIKNKNYIANGANRNWGLSSGILQTEI